MIVKALYKILKWLVFGVLEKLLKFLYLSLPLWAHMFFLQMRERVDVLPSITGYLKEDSTWAVIYDGVALVNTSPGAVREKINNFKTWVKKMVPFWITLAVLTTITLIALITVKVYY